MGLETGRDPLQAHVEAAKGDIRARKEAQEKAQVEDKETRSEAEVNVDAEAVAVAEAKKLKESFGVSDEQLKEATEEAKKAA